MNNIYKQHRTQSNYNFMDEKGEVNNSPSLTVPNEALTIREMLQNYVKGVPLPIGKEPIYHNPQDIEDIDETRDPSFDLADASMQARLLEEVIAERKAASQKKRSLEKPQEQPKQQASSEADGQTAQDGPKV